MIREGGEGLDGIKDLFFKVVKRVVFFIVYIKLRYINMVKWNLYDRNLF